MDQPRFVIINDSDAPSRRNVAQWVDGVGYCYMARDEYPNLKEFDGMQPLNPTPIEDFGFAILPRMDEVAFVRAGESVATYEDGKPRAWQDIRSQNAFTLPAVKGVRTSGKQIRKRQDLK